METRMTQPLSVYEKQALLKRFDLSDLSASDQQAFHSLLFDYLNEFPVMNEIAREVIDTGFRSIHITIKDDMKGAVGSQYGNNINFDTKYWDRHAFSKQGRNRLAATFWHEALHYLQEKKLPAATSKRAHIIYRQFIEAEANSISNLIRPNNRFEAELYRVALKKFKNLEDAQRYYLGISSRLRLHADRDLAKNEAKNIMGSSFSDHLWHDSEKSAVKHWRDFYYKYHNSHIARGGYKSIFFKKTKYDADIIRKMEDYFFNKYGISISPKSSISGEVIDQYGMTSGIDNTILVDPRGNEIFDISKWRKISGGAGSKLYILDLPNMDKNYITSLQYKLSAKGVGSRIEVVNHSDGSVSRCLVIPDDGSKNAQRFLNLCGVGGNEIEQEKTRPPMPPKPLKQVNLKKGMNVAVDIYNPPILKMGANKETTFDLKDILNQKRIDFLKGGGIMLLGRNPLSPYAKIPSEVRNYQGVVKSYQIGETDETVSNAQGYLYMARDGKFYYKDCSSYGTHLFLRPEKTFNKQMSYSR